MRSDGKIYLFIGIPLAIISLIAFFAIPSMIGMTKHERRARVKNNIHWIRNAMEDFADTNDETYPCSLTDTTTDGDNLLDFVYYNLTNPYTKNPVNLRFTGEPFSVEYNDINIPPGDIYVYCNGSEYLIIGGQEDGKPNSLRLSNCRPPGDN